MRQNDSRLLRKGKTGDSPLERKKKGGGGVARERLKSNGKRGTNGADRKQKMFAYKATNFALATKTSFFFVQKRKQFLANIYRPKFQHDRVHMNIELVLQLHLFQHNVTFFLLAF